MGRGEVLNLPSGAGKKKSTEVSITLHSVPHTTTAPFPFSSIPPFPPLPITPFLSSSIHPFLHPSTPTLPPFIPPSPTSILQYPLYIKVQRAFRTLTKLSCLISPYNFISSVYNFQYIYLSLCVIYLEGNIK